MAANYNVTYTGTSIDILKDYLSKPEDFNRERKKDLKSVISYEIFHTHEEISHAEADRRAEQLLVEAERIFKSSSPLGQKDENAGAQIAPEGVKNIIDRRLSDELLKGLEISQNKHTDDEWQGDSVRQDILMSQDLLTQDKLPSNSRKMGRIMAVLPWTRPC